MTTPNRASSREIQTVLDYDRTEFRFPGVYMMSFKAWLVETSPFHPDGVRYAFNLFAPDANGVPNTPILRFDNEHAAPGVKAPFDHWHPPRRGPGGKIIGESKEVALKTSLAELPYLFLQRSYALLDELGVDIDQGIHTLAPHRGAVADRALDASDMGASIKQRKKST